MKAQRILVSLDGMPEPIPAWSFGTTWNGWAEPWFDESQIDAAATALTRGGLRTRFLSRTSETISRPESFDDAAPEPYWCMWERECIDTPQGPRVAFFRGGLTWNDCTE